jgi:DNA-binding response OmpR family regulator
VDQATEIGADGVILKPFDEERLLMRVKACWDGADEASRIEISERAALSVELGV